MNKIEQPKQRNRPLSLYPLKFEEVIADVLKVKPEPKAQKKRTQKKKHESKR